MGSCARPLSRNERLVDRVEVMRQKQFSGIDRWPDQTHDSLSSTFFAPSKSRPEESVSLHRPLFRSVESFLEIRTSAMLMPCRRWIARKLDWQGSERRATTWAALPRT